MSTSVEVEHPLIRHHLSFIRDEETSPADFREHVRQLTVLLATEATRDLATEATTVTTPLTTTTCRRIAGRVALVPILRAGLGMVDPILGLLPSAEVRHLGLYRDEETATPVRYYDKLPPSGPAEVAMVVDPMLATGGSASAAIETLENWGVPSIKLLSLIAAPEGIARIREEHPRVRCYVCAVDERLNDQKFIVPGLGDAGDRIFNT